MMNSQIESQRKKDHSTIQRLEKEIQKKEDMINIGLDRLEKHFQIVISNQRTDLEFG